MKRGDIALIAAIVLIAASFLIVPRWISGQANSAAGKTYAKIMVGGSLYRIVELTAQTEDIPIRTEHGYNLLRVRDNGIEMIEADCPDRLCITFGFKERIGATIVCLPHRILVEIIGSPGEGGDIDAVVS